MATNQDPQLNIQIRATNLASREITRVKKDIQSAQAPVSAARAAEVRHVQTLSRETATYVRVQRSLYREVARVAGAAAPVLRGAASLGGLGAGLLTGAIAGALGVVIGRLGDMSAAWARNQQVLTANANAVGLNVRQYGALSTMFQRGGTARADADASVAGFTQKIYNAQHGMADPDTLAASEQLGVAFKNDDGSSRDPYEILRDFATKGASLPPDRRQALWRLLGISGNADASLTAPGLDQRYQAALQDQVNDARAAEELNRQLGVLSVEFQKLGNTLAADCAPALAKLVAQINDILTKLPDTWARYNNAPNDLADRIKRAVGPLPGDEAVSSFMLRLQSDPVGTLTDSAAAIRDYLTGSAANAATLRGDDPNRLSPSGPSPSSYRGGGQRLSLRELQQGLIQRGIAPEDAAGIAANLYYESAGGKSNAVNPTSGARGLAQWLGSRVSDFRRVMGVDLASSTAQQQLDFVAWELRNSERGALAAIQDASGIDAKTMAAAQRYERPSRMELAQSMDERLALGRAAAGGGGGASTIDVNVQAPAGTVVTARGPAIGNVNNRQLPGTQATPPAPGSVY